MSAVTAKCCAVALAAALTVTAGAARAQVSHEQVLDPVYGELLFEFYTQDYFSALVKTMAELQRQRQPTDQFGGRLPNHHEDAQLLLGGLSLAYGLQQAAKSAFEGLLSRRADGRLQRRAWHLIGRLAWHQNQLEQAEAALRRALEGAPDDEVPARKLLLAQILMLQERFAEAVAMLVDWQGDAELAPYAQYNLGVALVRDDEVDAGHEVLRQVTALASAHEEYVALADRARVALGFDLLEREQPAAAQQYLEQVRLEGPWSNRALLGAGWAASQLARYQDALIPWRELAARDKPESAVLEVLLAIPYAHGKLDLFGRAAEGYRAAQTRYLAERDGVDAALAAVAGGRLIEDLLAQTEILQPGPHRRPASPPVEETRYFVTLLASHDFRRALRNFRDLRAMAATLERSARHIDAFDDMVATRRLRYEQVLPQVNERLGNIDVAALVSRTNELQRRLAEYVASEDIVAVAPGHRQDQYQRVVKLGERLDRLAYTPEVEALTLAQIRLRGLLIWQFSYDFARNSWRSRRELGNTVAALDEARDLLARVQRARDTVPASFQGFDARIQKLRTVNQRLQVTTERTIALQFAALQQLASERLQAFRARIDRYLFHAKFGEAQSLDQLYELGGQNE